MGKENVLLFGTAGRPRSSSSKSSSAGVQRISELGLGCMEIEFVRGVNMSKETAIEVAKIAESNEVKLSAHAPYYINLNAIEDAKVNDSRERIMHTARIASACGASDIVFHAAFYLGQSPDEVYRKVKRHLKELVETLRSQDSSVLLRLSRDCSFVYSPVTPIALRMCLGDRPQSSIQLFVVIVYCDSPARWNLGTSLPFGIAICSLERTFVSPTQITVSASTKGRSRTIGRLFGIVMSS